MVYQGTIQNGVVVLENGVNLPEGAVVRVELLKRDAPLAPTHSRKDDILFRMGEYAAETGIPDLAVNIDHYLYGHPKATDAQ